MSTPEQRDRAARALNALALELPNAVYQDFREAVAPIEADAERLERLEAAVKAMASCVAHDMEHEACHCEEPA